MRKLSSLLGAMGVVGVCLALAMTGVAQDQPDTKPAPKKKPTTQPAGAPLKVATQPATPNAPPEPEGMVKIFNGKDLTDWDGDPRLWSVKDGCIRGETTKENPTKGNTFCIWKGGTVGDFELRLTYRLASGNSGIQYRSKHYADAKAANKWVVGGYQAEVAGAPARDGYIYEEKGKRGRMCLVGEKVLWTAEGRKLLGTLGDASSIAAAVKAKDWNDYIIIVKGNHIQHFINGVQQIDFTDEDPKNQAMSGIIALQIHAGGPMVVEFKNIRLKKYNDPEKDKK